jgi:hypothetical protein
MFSISTFKTDAFWESREGAHEVSARTFNVVMSVTTLYGFIVYGAAGWGSARIIQERLLVGWPALAYLVALLGISIVGMLVSFSPDPLRAYGGLSALAGSLGALIGPIANHYGRGSVADAAIVTLCITLVLGAAGYLYPRSLEHWGSTLCLALSTLVGAQLLSLSASIGVIHPLHSVVSWLAIILFSAFVVYDFNRAQRLTRTIPNAIQSGVAVFVDVTNLFVRLLQIFGQNKEDRR